MKLTELLLTVCLIGLLASMLVSAITKMKSKLTRQIHVCAIYHNARLTQAMDDSEKHIPDLDRGLNNGEFQSILKW